MNVSGHCRVCCLCARLAMLAVIFGSVNQLHAQTGSTGAVTGITLDASGAVLPQVIVRLSKEGGGDARSTTSGESGRFSFLLLSPGEYEIHAERKDFEPLALLAIHVTVTETLRVELHLQLATRIERAEVFSRPPIVESDSSALGRVVSKDAVTGLPLVTRNFAQITGLSPGVVVGVFNAGELGLGETALPQIAKSNDGIYVHGARSYDNNFELNGISVSDVQGSSAGSGGIPIPNPDTIEEFKVQTGLYDAAFGRYAGANISVITKAGSDEYHGTIFEFLRNDVLNANDFFLNEARQARPDLKQNQFGFTLGGPIRKQKLIFFGSYQGTRQVTGLAAGQARVACTATLRTPPLTEDRSEAAVGKLFGGMHGELGGIAVKPDGSNINPAALALLNFKLPDGRFLIPTPQIIDSSKPLASQGLSVFTEPCQFAENQVLGNLDYAFSAKSRFAGRLFFSDDNETVTFPGNGLNASGNIPGFPSPSDSGFRVFSLEHTYARTSSWLNQARMGYVRIRTHTEAQTAFKWSDIGVAEGEMNRNNELPSLNILGSISIAPGFPRTITQNSFVLSDVLSFVRGIQTMRLGGSITRYQNNVNLAGLGSFLQFLSWPDFLIGLSASDNGTASSNVFASFDAFGLTDREYRAWEGSAFAEDDFRISQSLTLNIGVRYERFGQFGDRLGRNSSFDISKADRNPPPGGSLDGYIVASNYPGTPPAGVSRVNNTFGNYGRGQNSISPRIGLAWQTLQKKIPLVLRTGYGIYYSRTTGQAFYQSAFGAPFSQFRLNAGTANANATFQTPFPQPFPTPDTFPLFPAYSPNTTTTIYTVAPGFRPAMIQQFSLNLQAKMHANWLFEAGYVGTRGTNLVRQRSLNQALSASPGNPIRGATSNTIANLGERVPIPGVPPDALQEMETEGNSWYNALEVSATKRMSHGFEMLLSYTFSKTLDTDGSDINSTSTGNGLTLGDQNAPGLRWGRASFDRSHRFVLSATWSLPSPSSGPQRSIFGGWDMAVVATIQSGTALTIASTNANNVFGISEDRAELSGRCAKNQLVTSGPIGTKLNNYFDLSCFSAPPVIGTDDIGTAFGNSGTGIVDGPGQENLDLAVSKEIVLAWPREKSSLQFRVEFFNAFNHPQFANPDTNFSSPTFGVINSTTVNGRVGQVAIRFGF